MAYSDKIYKKEKLISRTFYIDEKLYLELERLSKEVYEASISKLINVAIEELVEKEKIDKLTQKYVVDEIKKQVKESKNKLVLLDVPLLFETNLWYYNRGNCG